MVPPDEHLRCYHGHGGHYGFHSSATLSRYGSHAATRCWPQGQTRGGVSAPPQSSMPACFAVSGGAMAPRHRPARHHCYQHTASRRVVGELPWWGTDAVCGTLVLTSGSIAHHYQVLVGEAPLPGSHSYTPGGIWGWLQGACPAPLHGGLAVQVPAPLAREV
jgi:hypothetical protein